MLRHPGRVPSRSRRLCLFVTPIRIANAGNDCFHLKRKAETVEVRPPAAIRAESALGARATSWVTLSNHSPWYCDMLCCMSGNQLPSRSVLSVQLSGRESYNLPCSEPCCINPYIRLRAIRQANLSRRRTCELNGTIVHRLAYVRGRG